MSGPRITVVMTTYEDGTGHRFINAKDSLWSLIRHLKYDGQLQLHIADDGSANHEELVQTLHDIALRGWNTHGTASNAARRGIGASLNLALAKVDYLWLYTTDDWVLERDLDLNKVAKLMTMYDMVRLGPLHPNLRCEIKFQVGIGWWLDIDPSYGFAFATRPFVARLDMFNLIGKFNEGLDSYETERMYAERSHNVLYQLAGLLSDGTEWTHVGSYEVGDRKIEATSPA